ncbi:MAG: phosphotransferase family protein, partial [Henriciella sp.]|nr:phosphotransferase family protein [Henriciella sp.]
MGTKQEFERAAHSLFTKVYSAKAKLEQVRRLSGGANQETWALSGSGHEAVLRRAHGGITAERTSTAIGLPTEAAVIEAAGRSGVPVPSILHVLQPDDRLGEGFLMQHIAGETIARPILRDDKFEPARKVLSAQCGAALAGIHAIPADKLPTLPSIDGRAQIKQYEDIYRSFDKPHPVFELALTWLKANAPTSRQLVLVHGDFRLGNLMVDENGLAAILDWELAHLGDPREDLAWICVNSWRFGQSHNRVGGFGQLEDM